jgi:hypothetical protein
MKKVFIILSMVLTGTFLFGQNLRPVAQKVSDRKQQQAKFSSAQIFTVNSATRQQSAAIAGSVSNAVIMDFDQNAAQNLVSLRPENLNFIIPTVSSNIELELFQSNIFTPDFTVVTASNNLPVTYNAGVHYWGIIKGDNSSIAAISIFDNEVTGMISSSSVGNLVLGKMENDNTGRHILYNMKDLKGVPAFECFTDDDNASPSKENHTSSEKVLANCIRLYWEVNYDIFQNKGSVANATSYVTSIFNQSAVLYANDAIPVMLSQVFVWDTPSPYTGTSTSALLGQFQTTRNSFNGDFGHLLGFAGGGGVAASIGSLCSSNIDSRQCYSGISSSFSNVPTYSWTVQVVTHEQGHLMGSHHTHWCGWSGGPIDNCNTCWGIGTEGGCSNGPSVTSGTIMSYCHGCTGVGINFNNGFGPQPKAAILSEYNSGSCLMNCTVGCTDNYEPNNTKATAVSIPVNTDVSGLISPAGDMDWFVFNNTAAQRNIQVTLTSLPANYNIRLYRNGIEVGSSLNGGTTSETINYNTTLGGTYKIKVAGANGANHVSDCYTLRVQLSSTPFRYGNFGNAADGQNTMAETMFSFQPNPAKESVSVRFHADGALPYSISVCDLTGRQLMHLENTSAAGVNTSELSLEKLYKGIYLLRFEINNQSVTQKLVKE